MREGNTTKTWSFVNTMNITLPLSCSIQSELINCGSVQIQSEKNRTIQLDHHHIVVITRDNEMEKHAKLNRTDYIKSPESIEEVSTSVWSYQWNGASTKIWVIILTSTAAALVVLVVTIKFISYHNKDTTSSLSINIDNNINNIERQPSMAPDSTCVNTATNTAVYIVTDPNTAKKQEEVNVSRRGRPRSRDRENQAVVRKPLTKAKLIKYSKEITISRRVQQPKAQCRRICDISKK